MSDWKKVLGTVAPWIGAAATGGVPALVGMAAAQLSSTFGQEVAGTADAIAQAVSGATPDQMLALKQADNEFKTTMQRLGFEHIQSLEKVAADDRASARAMHTANKDHITPTLAVVISAAFFAAIYFLLTMNVEIKAEMRDVAMILLGTLAAAFTQVLNFYFGTSAGSKDKTDIIRSLGGKQ